MNIINDAIKVILERYELKINEDGKVIGDDAEEARIIENFIQRLKIIISKNIDESDIVGNSEFKILISNNIFERCELNKSYTWCENGNVFEKLFGRFYYDEFPVAYEFTFSYYFIPETFVSVLSGVNFNYTEIGKKKCYHNRRKNQE